MQLARDAIVHLLAHREQLAAALGNYNRSFVNGRNWAARVAPIAMFGGCQRDEFRRTQTH
jgi:hypothetical protein